MTASRILVVDDESDIRDLLEEILSDEGYDVSVAANAQEARKVYAQGSPNLVLLDIWMPDTDGITLLGEWAKGGELKSAVVMMSGHGTVDTAVEATRLGAVDFVEKPLSIAKLLRTVERALEESGKRGKDAARRLVPAVTTPVGKSRSMRELRDRIAEIARHVTNIVMYGEPGTGREAFARYMHSLGPLKNGPFVEMVAGSISDANAELQLYGEEGGAPGLLEAAAGGVLFINELEDASPETQKLLLSALEKRSFMRVGGRDEIALDVMFISSALPGFDGRVGDTFRRDLLGHLGVIPLRIPPLREYSEDVPELLRYYVDVLVDGEGLAFRRFGVAAQNRLRNYPWPGNVRELRNLVHRLLIIGGAEEISLEEAEGALTTASATDEALVKQDLLSLPLREARERFERAYLQQQLVLCEGKVGKLAERVGMERTHLYRKLRSLGVEIG